MNIIKIANKILFYSFLILGLILLISGIGHASTLLCTFISFVASGLLAWILKSQEINEKYMISINILLWINLFGEYVYYYTSIGYYDKILHLTAGFIISMIVYQYYLRNLKPRKEGVFFSVLGLLALWEIFEYVIWTYTGYPMMGVINNGVVIMSPIDDTMLDLICGAIGAVVYLVFKKEELGKEIRKEFSTLKR